MNKKEKSWKDITLKMAIELIQLSPENDLDLIVNRLAILKDQDPADIEKMTFDDIAKEYKEWDFVGTLPAQRKDETFKWNGVRYGRVNFAKLSLAQMVDIEEFYAMGFIENVHNILSILYLPTKSYNLITKKYTLESYEFNQEVADSLLDIDFDFVYGNLLFFWTIARVYTGSLKDYLIKKNQTQMMEIANLMGIDKALLQRHKD
jgi:hypothetical protein